MMSCLGIVINPKMTYIVNDHLLESQRVIGLLGTEWRLSHSFREANQMAVSLAILCNHQDFEICIFESTPTHSM